MSTPIPNINGASKEVLIKELKDRNIDPSSTSHELRLQARAYNKGIKMPAISEVDSESSDSELDDTTIKKAHIIKQTKIIYRDSHSNNVDGWKLKYDGKSSVREFLLLIEEKCRTKNFNHDHLVRVFPDFLEGLALLWFRSIYTQDLKWDDLSKLLIRQFEANDLQTDLKIQLFNMTQPKGMSVLEFTLRMKSLNNMLEAKLPEIELLRLAKKALLPMYTNLLVSRDISTFEQLTTHAGNLESYASLSDDFGSFNVSQPKADLPVTKKSEKFDRTTRQTHNFNNNNFHRNQGYSQNQYRKPNNNNYSNNYTKVSLGNKDNNYKYNKPSSSTSNTYTKTAHENSRTFYNKPFCSYCKLSGHVIEDCRKKDSRSNNPKVGAINDKAHNKSKN